MQPASPRAAPDLLDETLWPVLPDCAGRLARGSDPPYRLAVQSHAARLPLSSLTAGIDVLIADDVIFAEIGPGLDFDQHHRHLARVFHTVHGP
jgi:hypothetical protein